MKIGIVAATYFEIEPTILFLQQQQDSYRAHEFISAITGIGSIATVYHLTGFLYKQSPDYLIQAGIGGTFTGRYPPGEVVMIREETMGDLGAEDINDFKDVFDLGLIESSTVPFDNKRLINPHMDDWDKFNIPAANGITVNEITTRSERMHCLQAKYNCDIESMEGAAFHYVCLQENVPFIQLRSVSNYIGERDRNAWKLGDAIQNLNNKLITIIQDLWQQ